MDQCTGVLTVFFDEPFWVGVYERTENGKLEVCRVVFGAKPKDYTVYEYFLANYTKLRFSPPVEMGNQSYAHTNPKRVQRAISKTLAQQGVGTKAQQAIKQQQEQGKLERKARHKQRSEEEKQRRFDLRQEKKHKNTGVGESLPLCFLWGISVSSRYITARQSILLLQKPRWWSGRIVKIDAE